ncbi:MAG: heme NO-binding domain-containing protein [Candidatus Eisenbacteria bacterium]
MQGIIFNLLEQFIVEQWGAEAYGSILGSCALSTFEPLGQSSVRPDRDLVVIINRLAEVRGTTPAEVLRTFGRFAFPRLAARHASWLLGHDSALSLLLAVEHVIHLEVRRRDEHARPPHFEFESLGPGIMLLRYHSERKVCAMVAGMIDGVADHFHTQIQCEEMKCSAKGALCCEFRLTFAPVPVEAL